MKNDQYYLKRTIQLAREHASDGKHGPFAALVVDSNGDVIAEGWNSVVADHDPTAHAEVNAIRKACRNLKTHNLAGCILYTSCEPCPMCFGAILWARLARVVYAASRDDAVLGGFDDRAFWNIISSDIHACSYPEVQHVAMPEARNLFLEWAANASRQMY
ncbi:MAG: nucleoside deaminase [Lentisphaerae bacterium]|nr:MAG: nucleoside deaminase [Lentisphaerota bacterium]